MYIKGVLVPIRIKEKHLHTSLIFFFCFLLFSYPWANKQTERRYLGLPKCLDRVNPPSWECRRAGVALKLMGIYVVGKDIHPKWETGYISRDYIHRTKIFNIFGGKCQCFFFFFFSIAKIPCYRYMNSYILAQNSAVAKHL